MKTINKINIGNIDYVNITAEEALNLGASQEDVNDALALSEKLAGRQSLRRKIEVDVADDKSLLGVVADSSAYALDDTAMDILAVEASADSSYKSNRISLFEELHGADSWQTAVTNAQAWFDKRKSGEIKLPIDVKGIETVFTDVATKSTGVAMILEQAKQAPAA